MSEPARCVWCKVAVEGQFALGSACPHCGKVLILEGVPEVRQEHSYGNELAADPDVEGVGGRAWRILRAAVVERGPSGSVGSDWLVHAPDSHPFWWWYMVSVVHLRRGEGLPEPHVGFPGATHELVVLALDPSHPLPDVDAWAGMRYLTPPNLAEQFIVASDGQAAELGDLLVRHVVVDGVSPDDDFREYWQRAVASTAEHLRLGGHPDQEDDGG